MPSAVGILQGIEERQGGWHRFSIAMPGKQYPLKLDTKQEEIIEAARGAMGQLATWEYTEKEADKINPHTNQPYINRYLESVELGASEEAVATAGGKAEAEVDWDAKERRSYRSKAWAQAISAMQHTGKADDDAETLYARLKPLQTKIYLDIVGDFAHTEEEMERVPF